MKLNKNEWNFSSLLKILILLCGSIESSRWRAANDIDLVSNLLFTIRKIGSNADCTASVPLQALVRRQCICINTIEAKNQGINWPFVVAVHSMFFFSPIPFVFRSGVVQRRRTIDRRNTNREIDANADTERRQKDMVTPSCCWYWAKKKTNRRIKQTEEQCRKNLS